MKQYLWGLILFACLIGVGVFYYASTNTSLGKKTVYQALPKSTSLVLDVTDLSLLLDKLEQSKSADFFTHSTFYSRLKTEKLFLDTLMSVSGNFSQDLLIAVANIGGGEMGYLYIGHFNENTLFDRGLFSATTEQEYKDEIVFQLQGIEDATTFNLVQHGNVWIGSFHRPLVEDAISAIQADTPIYPCDKIHNYIQHNTIADINIFINQQQINNLSTIFLKANYTHIIPPQENNEWTFLSLKIAESALLWSSETIMDNVEHSSQPLTSKNQIANYLPQNTAYFESFFCDTLKHNFENDFPKSYWSDWIDDEYASFVLETFDTDFQRKAGMIFLAKNEELALANLNEQYHDMALVESYEGIDIYRFSPDFNDLFPHRFIVWDSDLFVAFDDNVIVANDIPTIEACIQKKKEENMLASSNTYQEYVSAPITAATFTYCDIPKWKKAVESMFLPRGLDFSQFNNFQQQCISSNDIVKKNGVMNFGSPSISMRSDLWETSLDAQSTFTPQQVKNHNDGSLELMTQDVDNSLYLISASGDVVFKEKIDGEIKGDIFQVDYYKNGKLQYVFNTTDKIYILDRNGNSVGDFPLNIPAKASNGLLVTNYDNTRKYRIFIATEHEKVYGFELDGKPLSGWSPKENIGMISYPLQHVEIDDVDYIYGQNNDGDFMAFARNGEQRFSVHTAANFHDKFIPLKDGFVNGVGGKVYKVTLKGELQTTQVVTGDYDLYRYVFSQEKGVQASAFCAEKKLLYAKTANNQFSSYTFPQKISSLSSIDVPKTYFFGYTGELVYAVDEKGNPHPDFPILSTSAPLIVKMYEDRPPILVTQNEEGKIKLTAIGW